MFHWIYTHVPPWAWIAIISHLAILGTVAYLILLERKIASWVQDRIGPNRVGPNGLLQPIADGLKFILKEDYRPANAEPRLFSIAPALMILVMIVSIAVIPWGGIKQTTKLVQLPSNTVDLRAAAAEQVPVGTTLLDVKLDAKGGGWYEITYRYPFQVANL